MKPRRRDAPIQATTLIRHIASCWETAVCLFQQRLQPVTAEERWASTTLNNARRANAPPISTRRRSSQMRWGQTPPEYRCARQSCQGRTRDGALQAIAAPTVGEQSKPWVAHVRPPQMRQALLRAPHLPLVKANPGPARLLRPGAGDAHRAYATGSSPGSGGARKNRASKRRCIRSVATEKPEHPTMSSSYARARPRSSRAPRWPKRRAASRCMFRHPRRGRGMHPAPPGGLVASLSGHIAETGWRQSRLRKIAPRNGATPDASGIFLETRIVHYWATCVISECGLQTTPRCATHKPRRAGHHQKTETR